MQTNNFPGDGVVNFDASRSNPIYGKSDTVQPESLTMRYFIKATKTADGGDGKIQADNKETISGDTAYNELRPTNGNYIKKDNTTAGNLKALDTQAKANADNIVKAESNAKAYSDQKLSEAENRAKADATEKANAAEAAAKADAQAKANAAQSAAAQDATNKANAAETNAKSYTDIVTDAAKAYAKTYTDEVAKGKANVSMDNINEAGKQVIRDLAKNEIKNSGIDTTGDTIIINKPMETKDIHVDGEITTTGGITAGGNIHGKGDLEIDGKTHLHGDTEIDKNLIVHGNERIDGFLDVGGDSHIHGSQTIDGDSHVKGNAEFDKDVTVHGSETIDKILHVKGDSETEGNSTVHGSQSVDGDMTVSGNGSFRKDLYVAGTTNTGTLISRGDAAIGGNTYITGNAKVEGDIYGRSFNVGSERYIDKNGVNANGHKIRNVADGEISPNSTDAVNGRQLYDVQRQITGDMSQKMFHQITDLDNRLTNNVNKVAAGAAAMANLHPLEYNQNDKVSVSAAVGSYKSQQALAVGAFYRPDRKTMVSVSGSLGSNDNMIGVGVSKRFGQVSEIEGMTEDQLRDEVAEIHDENEELRKKNDKLQNEVDDLKTAHEKEVQALNAKIETIMAELTNIKSKHKE